MIAPVQRHRRLIRWSLLIYWLLLFTATHVPPRAMPNTHVSDKLEHFTSFAILASLLELSLLPLRRSLAMIATISLAIILIYGALDELTQPFTGRTCDIYDWYGDASGAIFAVALVSVIFWLSRRRRAAIG